MKSRYIILCVIALFASGEFMCQRANGQQTTATKAPETKVSLLTYQFRGKSFACFVTRSTLAKAPRWDPEKVDPPISLKAALMEAKTEAQNLFPIDARFVTKKIILDRWEDIWFYDVQLEVFHSSGYGGAIGLFDVVVLPDGTVAERKEVALDPKSNRYLPVEN
jgi:hypothetical protein